MTNIAEWDRIPVIISFAEARQMIETYGFAGSQGQTVLEGQRLVPRGKAFGHRVRVHASGDDAASPADADRARECRTSRAVLRQPLCQERQPADHGEGRL